jgi:predicted anti-sigma-YlaC factor YlaD
MNEDPRMPDAHPEAQLASFVDGSATDHERQLVEAHLAECATCRADVAFAARGRAAMQALPEVQAPGLAEQGMAWLPQATPERAIPEGRRIGADRARSRSRFRVPVWQRVAWGSGIAVAASLAAVFLFANLQGSPTTGTAASGGQALESGGESFARVKSSTNYDRASVGALAARLVREARSLASDAAAPVPAAAPGFGGAATASAQTLEKAAATQAESCLQRASGVAEGVTPSYVELAAFEGTPAFIGAFRTSPSGGRPTQLLVVAASRADCQALYVVALPL